MSDASGESWLKAADWVTTHWAQWGPRKWAVALLVGGVGSVLLVADVGPPIQGMLARKDAAPAAPHRSGLGGSVWVAAGSNGGGALLLDNPSISGGNGPAGGGDVHISSGNAGPNGPGGDLRISGGRIRGGDAK